MSKIKIIISKHVIEKKMPLIKSLGWEIDETKIKDTITNPAWRGVTIYNQLTAMSLINHSHVLRIIFKEKDGIIFVITAHITKRGRYESTAK